LSRIAGTIENTDQEYQEQYRKCVLTSWNKSEHLSEVSRTKRKFVITSWNKREHLSEVSRTKRKICHD